MSYSVPQALVFQEFEVYPAEITDPLRACILGGHAYLLRHDDPNERPLGYLGAYDRNVTGSYAWPGRPVGAALDASSVRVFLEKARVKIFEETIGGGRTIAPVGTSKPNRISISGNAGFAVNGEDYPRLDDLYDRDVQPGDRAVVRGNVAGTDYTVETYVRRVLASKLPAVVGAVVADATNKTTQAASAVVTPGGAQTTTLTANLLNYSALADGYVNDTYTILVTKGTVANDMTTGEIRVTSASGRDDVAAVVPAASGVLFNVGARGLRLSLTNHATPAGLVAGQTWTVVVNSAHVAPTLTVAGTYGAETDTAYIVEVTRGGLFGASLKPQITVSTTTGIDLSGPTEVTGTAVAVPLGLAGLTVAIAATGSPLGLRKGDKFIIPVTAAYDGYKNVLELGHELPLPLQTAPDLDLTLYLERNIELPLRRIGFEPLVNFEVSDTQLTIFDNALVYDPDVTDGGIPVPLDVYSGSIYVEYRAWRSDLGGTVNSVSDVGALDAAIPGPLSPMNPVKWGVYKALANAGGTAVRFVVVADPSDLTDWEGALAVLVGREDVYSLAPMTDNRAVHDLVAAHCESQSGAEKGRWRVCFVPLSAADQARVVSAANSSNHAPVMATITDDPNSAGTQFTRMLITSGNANLIEMGVKPKDIARFLYSTSWGEESYQEFEIDEVLSEQSVRLALGHTGAVTTPRKVEFWHPRSKNEIAQAAGAQAASFGSRRVRAVWPDKVGVAGTTQPGYFVCAALAGLRSGVVPHQSLTNVELAGFDDLSRSTSYFNSAQLDILGGAGVWVVTQDPDGTVKTRHALTTDTSDVSRREESIVANVDSISMLILRRLRPYVGVMNVTPTALSRLRIELMSALEFLKGSGYTDVLGPQLIDGSVVKLEPHPVLKDRVVAAIQLEIPFPLNTIEAHLII